MRVWPVLCLALITLPGFGDPADASAQAPSAPGPPAAKATDERKPPQTVRTVTIDPNARPPVCRRVVPTGSRIAEQRCESPRERHTAADEANRDILRRDVQAMRDQQLMREQARAAAMAEAMRRRAQGQ